MESEHSIRQLAEQVGIALEKRALMLATAESCTGGWVAQTLTATAGSSRWFERGFVTYSNHAKEEMLGVSAATLGRFGAVSEEVVHEMVVGALQHSRAQVSVAISGIAGPGGGTADKPVGTVWLAWGQEGGVVQAQRCCFSGERDAVRQQAVIAALAGVLRLLCGE